MKGLLRFEEARAQNFVRPLGTEEAYAEFLSYPWGPQGAAQDRHRSYALLSKLNHRGSLLLR